MHIPTPKYKYISKTRIELIEKWVTPYGIIPKGAKSNGADVPWYLRWFVTKFGILLYGSIFHDYYYRKAIKTKRYADNSFKSISLYFAALRYKHNPIMLCIAKKKINIAHFAVTKFGKGNY